ncbi:exocyst complex component Sec10-like protein [Fennellomyces sp. T-0311]|nr:exocyst complex component Sec10-like protein [Fennellomyces sp. T-0311]
MSAPSRARAPRLFDLPSDVKKLLTIDTFKGNVSTDDFMEKISADLVERMNEYSGAAAFDPKPFIRTFENVLDELVQLRTRVQEQCDELENSTQIVEHQYKKDIADMQSAFEDVYRSYDSLESRIGEVGNTAIRIGEQLETIDKQRSRASESRDIIEYFMEFQEGNSERLSLLCEGGDEGQLKGAIICRRLNAVAKEVDTHVKARIGIEQFCESFEKEMLEDFDRAYKEGDPRVMAHRAKVLFEFNGGASCVQMYVNQHEFFISNKKIEEMEELRRSEDNLDLSNPNIPPPEVDTSLVKLYDDIRITVRKEANIISAVFPQPATVMQVFLQRVFAQSIQNHVELLLSRAQRYSHLAYLRTLASTHAETKRLVDNLKFYCDKEAKLTDAADATGLLTSASPEEALDRCMNDLFVPYTEADRYLEREKLALNELFGRIIAEFLNYMQERKKNSARNQSVLTRTLNQISASTSGAMLYPGSLPTDQPASPSSTNPFERGYDGGGAISAENGSRSGNGGVVGASDSGNLVTVDDDGFKLLSRDAIMRMLNIHTEAIVRCMELSDAQDLPTSIRFLYSVLLDFIGTKYLDIALDDIIEELGSKAEPDTSCFPVVATTTKVIQLMQKHFQTAVLPLVVGAPSVHRNILTSKNKFMSALENKANDVLRKELTSITAWLKELLLLQKRNDFRPRDEDVIMMSMGTQPCVQIVDFVTRIYRAACKSLQGKNLETFLFNIGQKLHLMLLDHFKKFYVTPTGGLLVSKDISKYEEVIQMFKIPALNDLFEMLRQLGNIFLVKPEILRSILSEGYLARLDPSMLYPYLEKRVDFKSAKLDRILGVVDENAANATPADSKSQRRSLFVNDNTVLKEMRKNYNKDFLNQEYIAAFKSS